MQTHPLTDQLMAIVQELPPDRQRQLLELARAWTSPGSRLTQSEKSMGANSGPLVERDGLLLVSARLDGAFVDHREIREEYLGKTIGPTG